MEMRTPASPQPWPETEHFWAAANDRRLLLKRCLQTGKAYYYPRGHSPFTGGDTEWIESTGKGHIYSFSVLPRAQPPYCIAYVTLSEGPTLLTNVLTDDLDSLSIGQSVHVEFVKSENGQLVPMFVPD